MELAYLFRRCINIPYLNVGVSANYATERVNNTLYIYFQHSIEKNDWKINFDFPAKPYRRMGQTLWFAHRGFLGQWHKILPRLEEEIADKSIRRIVVTGYSHGAAIAVLCHEYVWFNRPDLRNSLFGYGFGCPRVIWGIKRKNLCCRWDNFTVIRNIDDIVTHLPPALFGYIHVGRMLEVGERGKYSPFEAHYPENIFYELGKYKDSKDDAIRAKAGTVQAKCCLTKNIKAAP